MKTEITNTELNKFLELGSPVVDCINTSLVIDTDAFYIDASFNKRTRSFEVAAYLGETEIEFTENQKDIICNLLGNAEKQENEFSYDNQEHALSLIY